MTKVYKKIEISNNDDLAYFQNKLMEGLKVPSSFLNDIGILPGSVSEKMPKMPKTLMLVSYVNSILENMVNKNCQIIDIIENTFSKTYLVFYDDLTYTEFMLLN